MTPSPCLCARNNNSIINPAYLTRYSNYLRPPCLKRAFC
jgi:hypothetical protein